MTRQEKRVAQKIGTLKKRVVQKIGTLKKRVVQKIGLFKKSGRHFEKNANEKLALSGETGNFLQEALSLLNFQKIKKYLKRKIKGWRACEKIENYYNWDCIIKGCRGRSFTDTFGAAVSPI